VRSRPDASADWGTRWQDRNLIQREADPMRTVAEGGREGACSRRDDGTVDRVVVVGRGGAGKSVISRQIGGRIDAPVIELDALFWRDPGLRPLPPAEWVRVQEELIRDQLRWVADGDLGPHDVLSVRLRAADAVVMLDYSLLRCAWRAVRRSREGIDFWRWVVMYRRRWRSLVLAEVARHAPRAELHILRSPRDAAELLRALR
jgi:adenylate kinase family enzyme